MHVVVKTYKRADVARYGLEACVSSERDALVRLSNDKSGRVPCLLNAQVTLLSLSFVMTLAPGVTASSLPRPLPLSRVACIVRNLIHSLRIIHGFGIVHADIALRNVIVDSENHDKVCLVDFGSCFVLGSDARDFSQTTTANVLPPEMLNTTTPDPAVDVWGIGIFAWACMFGGGGPFHGRTNASILQVIDEYRRGELDIESMFREAFQKLGGSRSSNWQHANDFVSTCLSREPASRFAVPNTNSDWKDWGLIVDYQRIQAHPFLQLGDCVFAPVEPYRFLSSPLFYGRKTRR
ncbi:unnamed protein product [Agarophyton chilense]